ncbi:nitrogen regulatory protein P-II [Planctomycetota bacterium]|nr:nitrogen regulatory protein P-II [Planctomycetota bacterium]
MRREPLPAMSLLSVQLVVRPQRAEQLCQRLLASGWFEELTAVECRGYGRQKGHLDDYDGDEYRIDFLPKVLITGVIPADRRDELVELVCRIGRTGRIGDGKIFLLPVTALDFVA